MITVENETRGYYTLGFLNIKVNTTESLQDLNELMSQNSSTFSTFLHEYIHFLQNFTTTNGLYSSAFYLQFIKYLVAKIKEESNEEIDLPLKIDNDFNRISFNELNLVYSGQSGFIRDRVKYNSYSIEVVEITDVSDGSKIKPNKYIVNFTNYSNYKQEDYHFGTIALKEYVGHKIQNNFYATTHPDIPYLIAELLLDEELPELKDHDDLKILICDAALMNLHPAEFFFVIIEKLKKEKYPKEPLAFYNFIFKGINYSGKLGTFKNHIKLFDKVYQDICHDYKDIFGSQVFKKELTWFLHILKNARELRIKNPTFILNLVNSKGKFTIDFKRIIKSLGTPFFVNLNDEGGYIPPRKLKEKPDQIYILLAASELLFNAYQNKRCDLYNFCSKNFAAKDPTNGFCISNPFEKINEPDACPFVQLCKTWGIHEKKYLR
jgi:hypothetical protein